MAPGSRDDSSWLLLGATDVAGGARGWTRETCFWCSHSLCHMSPLQQLCLWIHSLPGDWARVLPLERAKPLDSLWWLLTLWFGGVADDWVITAFPSGLENTHDVIDLDQSQLAFLKVWCDVEPKWSNYPQWKDFCQADNVPRNVCISGTAKQKYGQAVCKQKLN